MSRARESGDRGERAAAEFLEGRGCEILAAQWRCRYGELDLVARNREGTICFVEVKLRGKPMAPGICRRPQAGAVAQGGSDLADGKRFG